METIALALFLLALLYAALVVAEEKRAYRENARSFQLGRFCFSTPSWWKALPRGADKIQFTSSSDWRGTFRTLPPNQQELQKSLAQQIKRQDIVFDPDSTSTHSPILKKTVRLFRMEGTATEREEHRIYFDAFLVECLKTGQRLYGESKSSVLSGPLEGPWFEECFNSCFAVLPDGKREERSSEFSLSKT